MRAPGQRALGSAVLTELIRRVQKASDETCRMPHMRSQLCNDASA